MAGDLVDKLQDEKPPSWIGSEFVAKNVCNIAYLSTSFLGLLEGETERLIPLSRHNLLEHLRTLAHLLIAGADTVCKPRHTRSLEHLDLTYDI